MDKSLRIPYYGRPLTALLFRLQAKDNGVIPGMR
jgi:hypothetical protein